MSPAQHAHARQITAPPTATRRPATSGWGPVPSRSSKLADRNVLKHISAETGLLLELLGLEAVVTARVKTPHSIAAKALRKGIAPEAVLDRLALRVCVPETIDCYEVYERICDRWPAIAGSQDDYIATPKANGYQSLHAAVRTPLGTVEFQVRTHAMNRHAEVGGASHRAYKQMVRAA